MAYHHILSKYIYSKHNLYTGYICLKIVILYNLIILKALNKATTIYCNVLKCYMIINCIVSVYFITVLYNIFFLTSLGIKTYLYNKEENLSYDHSY